MENYFEPCLAPDQLRAMSSIGLAHIGDAVFEILARTWLCAHGRATGRGLHQAAVRLVCAESQARRAERFGGPFQEPKAKRDGFFKRKKKDEPKNPDDKQP